MTKHPKFFCENCKAEVRRDAMICPHCGRFFASVRCPACDFTGTHKEFKDGCPACGYAFNSDGQHSGSGTHKTVREAPAADSRKGSDEDPLPLWVYGIVLSLAVIIFAIFFFNY